MPLFTSPRERRFWLFALCVQVAIYATAGLAGTLAEVLREQNLLGVAFGACFVLVIAAIVTSGLKQRPGGREIWAMLGLAAVYGMVIVRLGIGPAERTHLFEYGLVGALIHQALTERRGPGQRVAVTAMHAVGLTAVLGFIDECIQWLLPSRVYDIRDVGFNALAGLMAVAARLILSWLRRRRTKHQP